MKKTHQGDNPFNNLVVLEMANNHMGDLNHGLKMIQEFAEVVKPYKDKFNFAWKFQFRDIDTFIHPDFQDRTDIKYVKRFKETKLSEKNILLLKEEASNHGFLTMCTAFDENSVDLLSSMNFDIAKIASCSSTDWPLLNKISELDIPIIASTAGTKLEDIDNVVSFFQHRNKQLAIMHCVGEYPTDAKKLQLNQIDLFKERYKDVTIGFSTHEHPNNPTAVKLAVAKGVTHFEKHIAVDTEQYPKNGYSATPKDVDRWLSSMVEAYEMCGIENERHIFSDKEISDLRQFRRGVFAKRKIKVGESLNEDNVFYAWPNQDEQLLSTDMSKFIEYTSNKQLDVNEPIFNSNIESRNRWSNLWNIVNDIKSFINKSGVVFPGKADLEISHHYGIENFYETGLTMITVVNREYCKKLIIVLPGQRHPEQHHKQKEETFMILHGKVNLFIDGVKSALSEGDTFTIFPPSKHSFSSENGCVIEEVSSTHFPDDSFYTDETINKNPNRKTIISYWR